ncbi:MAG: hypothetical protein ACFYI8_00420 [Candidatus Karelsulcia muelleri]
MYKKLMVSCNHKIFPKNVYMPDMYYSNLSMLDRCKIAEYVMNLKYKN